MWGGAGAASLGLEGEVGVLERRAVFGTGGARHPESGERLVHGLRPGMELVVVAAQVGGRARRDRPGGGHALGPGRRARRVPWRTWNERSCGRRAAGGGLVQARVPTAGLTWAASRHATTRAGDPQVHDHVLVANVVKMARRTGRLEGGSTPGLLRDHPHPATATGCMAAAAKAVELGDGIEADPGFGAPWWPAVAGIPKEAWGVHATRAGQINAAVGHDASYRSRAEPPGPPVTEKPRTDRGVSAQVAGRAGPSRLPAARGGRWEGPGSTTERLSVRRSS